MAFIPGVSGNPSGRKKANPKVVKALRAATLQAVRVLISLLDSDDDNVRLKAANIILERELGKPIQPIGNDNEKPFLIKVL